MSPVLNRSNVLLVLVAACAFLGAAILAVAPIGTGIEFVMPIDLSSR